MLKKKVKGFMLAIRLFYDNFTREQVPGIFSVWHFVFIGIFAALVAAGLYLCRNLTGEQTQKLLFWIAIGVSVVEVIKITLRVLKESGTDSWIPLYYCSLFIYAVWMSRSKVEWLSRMGYAYMTMGGILAACLFTLYPSTSLALYPAWHPASLHSLLYHTVMAFTGLLILWKKQYVPRAKDGILYAAFVLLACVIGFFINEWVHSNCMFLHYAFKLPILDDLLEFSHPLYILVVVLAQAAGMFWANFGLYRLFTKGKNKGE